MKFHPLADLFPLMEGTEFDELAASIKAHGLRDAITLLDGTILDGRNRFRACEKAGVEARFEQFTGHDPHAFVADKNLHRRNLNETQRALIAGKMANLTKGGDRRSDQFKTEISGLNISNKKAAELLNVSEDMVGFAKTVLKHGTAEEIKAIERGDAAVSTVAKQIKANIPKELRGVSKPPVPHQRSRAQIWGHLRDGLTAFTNLPAPADVASIAKAMDRLGLVDRHLSKTREWLTEFSNAWSKRND